MWNRKNIFLPPKIHPFDHFHPFIMISFKIWMNLLHYLFHRCYLGNKWKITENALGLRMLWMKDMISSFYWHYLRMKLHKWFISTTKLSLLTISTPKDSFVNFFFQNYNLQKEFFVERIGKRMIKKGWKRNEKWMKRDEKGMKWSPKMRKMGRVWSHDRCRRHHFRVPESPTLKLSAMASLGFWVTSRISRFLHSHRHGPATMTADSRRLFSV